MILCLVVVIGMTCGMSHAAPSRRDLTQLLIELSEMRNERISFSPSFTDRIYPANTSLEGPIAEVLDRLLDGTRLAYGRVKEAHYYIYRTALPPKPVKPVVLPEPAVVVVPPPAPPQIVRMVPVAGVDSLYIPPPQMAWTELVPIVPDTDSIKRKILLLALKSNLLYDATSTFNLGFEVALGQKWTLDVSGNYNPWTFSDNRKMKHWLVQPELRWWTCSRFNGGFWGIHAHYGQYNLGGMLPWGFHTGKMFGSIENKQISDYRYEGWLAGAGIGYGYHWILGNRWGLEAEIGVGYAYLNYDKYRCERCGVKIGRESKHYFGPTKASISLVFIIK